MSHGRSCPTLCLLWSLIQTSALHSRLPFANDATSNNSATRQPRAMRHFLADFTANAVSQYHGCCVGMSTSRACKRRIIPPPRPPRQSSSRTYVFASLKTAKMQGACFTYFESYMSATQLTLNILILRKVCSGSHEHHHILPAAIRDRESNLMRSFPRSKAYVLVRIMQSLASPRPPPMIRYDDQS